MVPVLNSLGVHAAVYGNHDFGEDSVCNENKVHYLLS